MSAKNTQPNSAQDHSDLTVRQGEVLDAALQVLVLVGDKLTMIDVAKAASCSKETLYNWFGDREGLLVATVQWQAAKVEMPAVDLAHLDADNLAKSIEQFGCSLLGVLTSKTSVALNRMAIARAGARGSKLGDIVLLNGRFAMGRRLKPLLEAGRDSELLAFNDSELVFTCFFGFLLRDTQIRLLLGENIKFGKEQIGIRAKQATAQFMVLFSSK